MAGPPPPPPPAAPAPRQGQGKGQAGAGAGRGGFARAPAGEAGEPRAVAAQALLAPRPVPPVGDAPGARCGHTLTTVAPPGAPAHAAKLVLFGGATALEGGTGGSSPGTPTASASAGGTGIRLAGATNDVHVFDVATGTWRLLQPEGEPPSARAAHSAAAVGTMVVVHGGIGPAGLSGDDLHVLDVSNWDRPRWHRVVVPGQGPGARYAHCASLVAQRFLLVLGGNDGQRALGDVWALDTSQKPYRWTRVDSGPRPNPPAAPSSASPPPPVEPAARMYASTASRSDGLLLLCGGRDGSGRALSEAFGLARHRDGRWEWANAPGAPPGPARYQHGCAFVGAKLHLVGGALGGGRVVEPAHAIASLDTAQGTWQGSDAALDGGASAATGSGSRRCRHAVASAGSFVFSYGGLASGVLLNDLLVFCDPDGVAAASTHTDPGAVHLLRPDGSTAIVSLGVDLAASAWSEWANAVAVASASIVSAASVNAPPHLQRLVAQSAEEAAVATRALAGATAKMESDGGAGGAVPAPPPSPPAGDGATAGADPTLAPRPAPGLHPIRSMSFGSVLQAEQAAERAAAAAAPGASAGADAALGAHGDVRLYHRAVVVAAETDGELGGLVRQLSIDQFENESRRMSRGEAALDPTLQGAGEVPGDAAAAGVADRGSPPSLFPPGASTAGSPATPGLPLLRQPSARLVHRAVLNTLLRPRELKEYAPMDRRFFLSADEFIELCDQVERIFIEEPTVLEVRAPVKIFGDLHGQFGDLMRLFDEYGAPSLSGDITYIDYLFLGDYVDRGMYSLETIALLFALKIEYPSNIHMIRGNHEAKDINALFGFRTECAERFGAQRTSSGGVRTSSSLDGHGNGGGGGVVDALETEEPLGAWGEDLYAGGDDDSMGPHQGEGLRAWARVNETFDWMPLCANIEGKILCMHGGIGRWIESVEQIRAIKRPVGMEDGGQLLMDLLWSDPTSSDDIHGVQPSPRGPGLVTFGPDRVDTFVRQNRLQMIVRAHECVMDGFERFAGGKLITLFSATNYCGSANNAGAILVLGRDLVMIPKLIHPLPPQPRGQGSEEDEMDTLNSAEEEPPTPLIRGLVRTGPGGDIGARAGADGGGGPFGEAGADGVMTAPTHHTWMSRVNEERPPTPPRGRGHASGASLAYI